MHPTHLRLPQGKRSVVDQMDQDPLVVSSAVWMTVCFGVAVSPQQNCIWEVSIGIPDLFGMPDRLNGHHDEGILLGLRVKRGKTGIITAVR